jgi:hypothetical protein
MNSTIFRQFLARIPDRTKVIIIAVLAFGVGTLFAGSGGNGRYTALGTSGTTILDTKTGNAWRIDPEHPGTYTRVASFSYF